MTNVIRHSGARNCWVDGRARDCLEIEDDGRGPATVGVVPAPPGAAGRPGALRTAGSGLAGSPRAPRQRGRASSPSAPSVHGGVPLLSVRKATA